MRKIIIFIIVITVILFTATFKIYATDSTASGAAATPSPTNLKIKELKDRLASRVAQLNVLSENVLFGEIKTLSDQKIIILSDGNEINVNLNDDTTYSAIGSDLKNKTIKIDGLKAGQNIVVWGSFNSSTNTITAKGVAEQELPLAVVGVIKSIDKKNYQFNLSTSSKNYLVDHQTKTGDFMYDQDKGLVKSGFSKISENQSVYVVGSLVTTDGKELLSADRIIILSTPTATSPSVTPTPTKSK